MKRLPAIALSLATAVSVLALGSAGAIAADTATGAGSVTDEAGDVRVVEPDTPAADKLAAATDITAFDYEAFPGKRVVFKVHLVDVRGFAGFTQKVGVQGQASDGRYVANFVARDGGVVTESFGERSVCRGSDATRNDQTDVVTLSVPLDCFSPARYSISSVWTFNAVARSKAEGSGKFDFVTTDSSATSPKLRIRSNEVGAFVDVDERVRGVDTAPRRVTRSIEIRDGGGYYLRAGKDVTFRVKVRDLRSFRDYRQVIGVRAIESKTKNETYLFAYRGKVADADGAEPSACAGGTSTKNTRTSTVVMSVPIGCFAAVGANDYLFQAFTLTEDKRTYGDLSSDHSLKSSRVTVR